MNISLPRELKRFVDQKVSSGRYKSSSEVVHEALRLIERKDRLALAGLPDLTRQGSLGGSDGDIEAIAFIVMMQATKDMDEDLKMIMAEVKSMTASKQTLRALISQVNKDVAANAGQQPGERGLDFTLGLGSERAYHRVPMPVADPEADCGVRLVTTDLCRGKLVRVEQLHSILDELKSKLDGLSEMSEMTSLRLQMMMDRRSKFLSTLSNIMKKISTTQDTLVQNLK